MATPASSKARYTYRLRVSSTARIALEAEWSRCRWVWNECVARTKRAFIEGETCGPARLDKMLTEARGRMPWLAQGSCGQAGQGCMLGGSVQRLSFGLVSSGEDEVDPRVQEPGFQLVNGSLLPQPILVRGHVLRLGSSTVLAEGGK